MKGSSLGFTPQDIYPISKRQTQSQNVVSPTQIITSRPTMIPGPPIAQSLEPLPQLPPQPSQQAKQHSMSSSLPINLFGSSSNGGNIDSTLSPPKFIYLKYKSPDDTSYDPFFRSDGVIIPYETMDKVKVVYVEGGKGEKGDRGEPGIGIRGDEGKEGPPGIGLQGTPGSNGRDGADCVCLSRGRRDIPRVRVIRAGGNRSIYKEDRTIILDTNEIVTLILPDIDPRKSDGDADFFMDTPCVRIICRTGQHKVVSINNKVKINQYHSSVSITINETTKLPNKYKFILMDIGGWIQI